MEENKTIIINHGREEWYQDWYECDSCKESFMTDNQPNFCPCCGKKIIGMKKDKETVYFSY